MNEEKKSELFTALSKAQGEFEKAKLDCTNPFYNNSKYASLSSVWAVARKPLSQNGLCIIQGVIEVEQKNYLQTKLCHTSGETIEFRCPLMIDKNNMQGLGSAITYAKRYSLASMLGIVDSEDDDGNGSLPQGNSKNNQNNNPPPPEKKQEVTKRMMDRLYAIGAENGWKCEQINAKIKEKFKIASSKDMTRKQYDEMEAGIKKFPRHNKVEPPADPPPPDDFDQTVPDDFNQDFSNEAPMSDLADQDRIPEKKSDLRTPAQSYILEAPAPYEHMHGKTIAECDREDLKNYFEFLAMRSKAVPPPKGLRKIMEMQNKIGKYLVGE